MDFNTNFGFFFLFAAVFATVSTSSNVEVNFQTSSTRSCSDGLKGDVGEAFGDRGNGYIFGWISKASGEPVDAKQNTRDLWQRVDDSCISRTFTHMQYSNCCSDFPNDGVTEDVAWKIMLPNGLYKVTVTCGEPTDADSSHGIDVNGISVVPTTKPNSVQPTVRGTQLITVNDGAMVFEPSSDANNTKLSHILIEDANSFLGSSVAHLDGDTASTCVPFPSKFNGKSISSLNCDQVKVTTPYQLSFNGSHTGLEDRNGLQTGFTMFLPNSNLKSSYDPTKLEISENKLKMWTAPGNMNKGRNTQMNALGVGLPLPDIDLSVKAVFEIPNGLQQKFERACLYFAISESKHVRACFASTRKGERLFVHYESDDKKISRIYHDADLGPNRLVTIWLDLYPLEDLVKVYIQTDAMQLPMEITSISTDSDLFSKDAAGIDYTVGTRSFAGVAVSSAFNEEVICFTVHDFSIIQIPRDVNPAITSLIDFETWYISAISYPTAMVYGPDGKLYVSQVDGSITVLTLDTETKSVLSREKYLPLGNRLLLGITIDPTSSAENITLWLSHSYPSQNNGRANSGTISKVWGANFENVEDVVIGLPRAIADHATNQLHFGPDNRLYIAVGGNTGGGAPNDNLRTDFGPRPEQCLSAALLVGDVKSPNFRGNCTPAQDPEDMDRTGIADGCEFSPCDMHIYASGTRNPYDFTFLNGHIYMTDNGLGGGGTAPKLPDGYVAGDRCDGPVHGDEVERLDPGRRDDLLFDIQEGKYYGHPNPSRRQCIYYGGNPTRAVDFPVPRSPIEEGKQYSMDFGKYPRGTQPDANYTLPMFTFGRSHSANGIIAYGSDVFCGNLRGDLLTTYYSQEDQVRRVQLSEDGTAVLKDSTLARTSKATGADLLLRNPLAIAQDPHGNIFIAEFFGSRVRVLDPIGQQCFVHLATKKSSSVGPQGLAHAGAATVGMKVYTFGGRKADGTVTNEIFEFNTVDKTWTHLGVLPERLFGMSVTKTVGDRILIVGGFNSEGEVVSTVHEFDAVSRTLKELARMPESRASASMVFMADEKKVIIMGGVDQHGLPTDSVLEFRLEVMVWREVSPLTVAKSGAAAAVLGQLVMICGGTGAEGNTLSTCESFDGTRWRHEASMPTARIHAAAVVVDGKLVVKGGETDSGQITKAVEEYDPLSAKWRALQSMKTGRSAFVSARIGSGIYNLAGRSDSAENVAGEIFYYK